MGRPAGLPAFRGAVLGEGQPGRRGGVDHRSWPGDPVPAAEVPAGRVLQPVDRPFYEKLQRTYEARPRAVRRGPDGGVQPVRVGPPFHEPDPKGLLDLGIPADHVMFSSDFTHPEALADPLAYAEVVADLPAEQQALIMGGSLAQAMKIGAFCMSQTMEIARIGVVGGGLMGAGIAEVTARAGLDVVVVEVDESAVEPASARIHRSLQLAVDRGKLGRGAGRGRRSMQVVHLVAERARRSGRGRRGRPEQEPVKVDAFRTLDKVVDRPDALLASNTSSIPIMKLAMATRRPERVIGIALLQPCPRAAARRARAFADVARDRRDGPGSPAGLGKHVIRSQDRAGFVVNALLVPYILSAIRMLESGFATAEDIDQGMVQGCAHPMGPLALADLIGLDTISDRGVDVRGVQGAALHAAPILSRMVDAGLLGRKSGRGFFDYGG